jgi:cytochrome c oxidase accessory protein FixG
MKLDKSPFSLHKFFIKFKKHTLWIVFSLFTGFTFVGYFTAIRELSFSLTTFDLGEWETFWLFFYAFATYGNAGWMREQVCIYMCPYARFQSAMFDKDTMIIAYDEKRGEPRGTRKRGADHHTKGLGDCVNCTMCVQACPTGIDIRDGLQYQCVSCSACIDICNEVMDKMGYERGLIRYTTENLLNGKQTHILRPRIFVYGGILLAMFIGTLYAVTQRIDIQLDVIRDRNSLFRETNEGLIENVYVLKVMNIDQVPHTYHLTVSGIKDVQLKKDVDNIEVDAGKVLAVAVRLTADPANLDKRSTTVSFTLIDKDNPASTVSEEGRFLGPSTIH